MDTKATVTLPINEYLLLVNKASDIHHLKTINDVKSLIGLMNRFAKIAINGELITDESFEKFNPCKDYEIELTDFYSKKDMRLLHNINITQK